MKAVSLPLPGESTISPKTPRILATPFCTNAPIRVKADALQFAGERQKGNKEKNKNKQTKEAPPQKKNNKHKAKQN